MGKKVIIAFLGNVKYDARCINISNTLFNYGYKVIIVDELDGENNILEHDRFKIIHIDTKTKTGIRRYWKYHFNVQKIARYEAGISSIPGKKNVIKLSSNESPFGPTSDVKKAILESLHKTNKYPDGNCSELKEAISNN